MLLRRSLLLILQPLVAHLSNWPRLTVSQGYLDEAHASRKKPFKPARRVCQDPTKLATPGIEER